MMNLREYAYQLRWYHGIGSRPQDEAVFFVSVKMPYQRRMRPISRHGGHHAASHGAQILCESLIKEGVDTIFGMPGGAIIPLYDTLFQYPFRHILCRHEQGASHMADGYARITGNVGVCPSR